MDANLTDSLVIDGTALLKTELADEADRPESFRGSASDNQAGPKHPGALEPLSALAVDPTSTPKSIEEWASALKMACRAKKKNIFRLARMFHAAKSSLHHHGEWTRMWELKDKSERPPMSKRNGDRHALIGEVFGDVNETWPSHLVNLLPGCVEALGFLAQIGRQLVLELILDGKIDERMTAAKARELRNQYRPDLNKHRPFSLDRFLTRFHRLIGVLETEGEPEDVQAALPEMREIIDALKAET